MLMSKWKIANKEQGDNRLNRCKHEKTSTNRATQGKIIKWCKDCGKILSSKKS